MEKITTTPILRDLGRALLLRFRWILGRGLLAAGLAAGVAALLPLPWESATTILPPERRTDEFRYHQNRVSGLRRMVEAFRLRDRTHPIEIYLAVLRSEETARRVVADLGLRERWDSPTLDHAVERLQRSVSVEALPYGAVEVRARTSERQLSAEIANRTAAVLETRLQQIYRRDREREQAFLGDELRESFEELLRVEARHAASRIESGVADAEAQREALSRLTTDLALQLSRARTNAATAEREHGAGSPEARDARVRLDGLERVAAATTRLGEGLGNEDSREAERERTARTTEFLETLREQVNAGGAVGVLGVRVLDEAIPAERPDFRSVVAAAILAFLAIPVAFLGGRMRLPLREALLRQGSPGTRDAVVRGLARALDTVLAPAVPARLRGLALVLGAAGAGVLFALVPLALASLLGIVFLIVLASSLEAAWLLLVVALPWAWDYVNWDLAIEIQIPTEPGIILFVGAWIYSRLRRGRLDFPTSPLLAPLFLTLAWIAITATTSLAFRLSVQQLVAVTGFVLAGCLFPIAEVRRLATVEKVLKIYVFSGAALAIVGLVQVIRSPLPLDRAAFFMGAGLLHTHGPYATYLGYGLGPALVFLLTDRKAARSWPLLAATALMVLATVVSLTRAAWVAVAALLLVIAIARFRTFAKTLALPLAGAALVLVPVFLTSPQTKEAFGQYLTRSVSASYGSNVERLNRWQAGLRMVADRPLTGVGPSAYETAYASYRDIAFVSALSNRWMGAHSDLVRTFSEQGLPGLLILTMLVVAFYRTGLRLMLRGSTPGIRPLAAAVCAGVFTYTVHGVFNEYWRLPKTAFTLWIFVGLLGALDRIERERPDLETG